MDCKIVVRRRCIPLSPWLSRSHLSVNIQGSNRASKPSITNGFPSRINRCTTSFSNWDMVGSCSRMASMVMRSMNSKLGLLSTNSGRLKSAGRGSNDAWGRRAGILTTCAMLFRPV